MKSIRRHVLFASLISLLTSSLLFAADKGKKADAGDPMADPQMKAMMETWEKYSTPGKEHANLQKAVGSWKVAGKFWMGGPGEPPMESTGTSEIKSILGGRYVIESYKSEFMGKPFEGMGLSGFDLYKKKYVSTWMDNMGTAMWQMMGTCTDDHSMCTFFGMMDEFLTNDMDKMVKATHERKGADHAVFTVYDMMPGGKEFKTMELSYTRVK